MSPLFPKAPLSGQGALNIRSPVISGGAIRRRKRYFTNIILTTCT